MSFWREALSPRVAFNQNPLDDQNYPMGEGVLRTQTGQYVGPESAMQVRAVYRCVALLAGIVGYLPLIIYRRLQDGGKERATSHPLFRLFQLGPNRWQTAEQWLKLVMAHLLLRGNSFNQIIPGPRGIVDQLVPLHPARVSVEVKNDDGAGWVDASTATMGPAGIIRYLVKNRKGVVTVLTEDEVFHIRGLSSNGVVGLSTVTLMREAIGLSLATEGYGARYFSQNATPRGVFKVKTVLSKEAYDRLKHSIIMEGSGLENAHRPKILEEGAEWQTIGMSNEDSQFLELRKFQVGEIAGWFGVPPHLVGDVDKSTSWGSGLAEQNIALLTYTVAPLLECVEQSVDKELIVADQTYFAEFLVDALLRADPKAQADAENVRIMNGTLSRNEARSINNRNPAEGGDDFMVPLNMQVVGQPEALDKRIEAAGALVRAGYLPEDAAAAVGLPKLGHLGLPPVTVQAPRKPKPEPPPGEAQPNPFAPKDAPKDETPPPAAAEEPPPPPPKKPSAAAAIVADDAENLVHKERQWIATWGPRCAAKPEAWRDKVHAFYATHEALLVKRLKLEPEAAVAYCSAQRDALLEHGVAVVETWGKRAEELAALALGEEEAA